MATMKIGECRKFELKVAREPDTKSHVVARNEKEAKKLVIAQYGEIDFTLTPIPFSENAERG